MSPGRRPSMRRAVRLSEQFFRALLFAYPTGFRVEFGEPMAQTFRDQLQAAQTEGVGHIIGLWQRTLSDLAASALHERIEEMRGRELLLLCAVALGIAIAWVDSRPSWDDTGITAGTLFIVCTILGVTSPKQAWQWALSVGIWIPLYGVLWTHNYGCLIALIPAFLGAYLGAGFRSLAFPPPSQA